MSPKLYLNILISTEILLSRLDGGGWVVGWVAVLMRNKANLSKAELAAGLSFDWAWQYLKLGEHASLTDFEISHESMYFDIWIKPDVKDVNKSALNHLFFGKFSHSKII